MGGGVRRNSCLANGYWRCLGNIREFFIVFLASVTYATTMGSSSWHVHEVRLPGYGEQISCVAIMETYKICLCSALHEHQYRDHLVLDTGGGPMWLVWCHKPQFFCKKISNLSLWKLTGFSFTPKRDLFLFYIFYSCQGHTIKQVSLGIWTLYYLWKSNLNLTCNTISWLVGSQK